MKVSVRQYRIIVIAAAIACASAVSWASGDPLPVSPGVDRASASGSVVDIIEDLLKGGDEAR